MIGLNFAFPLVLEMNISYLSTNPLGSKSSYT